MLNKNKCCIYDCLAEISTFEEVATGICSFHRNYLDRRGYYVGICWECSTITGIYEVPRRLLLIWDDKIVFSKGCSKCSNDHSLETAWITLNKLCPQHRWAIDTSGKLVQEPSTGTLTEKKEEHNEH